MKDEMREAFTEWWDRITLDLVTWTTLERLAALTGFRKGWEACRKSIEVVPPAEIECPECHGKKYINVPDDESGATCHMEPCPTCQEERLPEKLNDNIKVVTVQNNVTMEEEMKIKRKLFKDISITNNWIDFKLDEIRSVTVFDDGDIAFSHDRIRNVIKEDELEEILKVRKAFIKGEVVK